VYISAKEVESKIDIVALIESYGVKLRRRNEDNYIGLCAMHPDKNPSLSVSRRKKVYHCFGCGASGNVFNFIMKKEGIRYFPDAVRRAAEIAGIKLSKETPTTIYRKEHKK